MEDGYATIETFRDGILKKEIRILDLQKAKDYIKFLLENEYSAYGDLADAVFEEIESQAKKQPAFAF